MPIEKNQNPGGCFEPTSYIALPIQPIYLENGLIAMGADYPFEMKNIEIWVPTFFKHNNSSLATVIVLWLIHLKGTTTASINVWVDPCFFHAHIVY